MLIRKSRKNTLNLQSRPTVHIKLFAGREWFNCTGNDENATNRKNVKNTANNRFGNNDEVADLAVFLMSDEAKFMNGAIVSIDGGYTQLYRRMTRLLCMRI